MSLSIPTDTIGTITDSIGSILMASNAIGDIIAPIVCRDAVYPIGDIIGT